MSVDAIKLLALWRRKSFTTVFAVELQTSEIAWLYTVYMRVSCQQICYKRSIHNAWLWTVLCLYAKRLFCTDSCSWHQCTYYAQENATIFKISYQKDTVVKAMPRCLLSESEHRFHLRDMDDETFLTISREYYEILHDIDNFCQTVGSQGKECDWDTVGSEPWRVYCLELTDIIVFFIIFVTPWTSSWSSHYILKHILLKTQWFLVERFEIHCLLCQVT